FGETLESSHEPPVTSDGFRFTGQYLDSETGMYYLRARMYSPYLGRFASHDPVMGKFEEPMTLHKYLYCGNDPVNGMDPTGLWNDGIRYAIRESGLQSAYGLSDDMIKKLYPGIWAQSYETYKGSIWHGHSDMGYHTGDFDYTTLDHMDWSRPTKPWAIKVFNLFKIEFPDFPSSGYPLHFQSLDKAQKLVNQAIYEGDPEFFQAVMHMGQDYFSHYNKGYGPTLGHAFAEDEGHAPDNPYVKGGASTRQLDAAYLAADEWTKSMENRWYFDNDIEGWLRLP
ncbi:MAG: RHS repeat-associated core domain-containing protein, partial [Calditrichaceae bacterium]|nr:RHS repeat-associated core domain-containing protein [Calditrichaceae bacterium]